MRNVQPHPQAPVVAVAGLKGIGRSADRTDVIEQGKAHTHAAIFFKNRDAVFQRAEPVGVTTDRLVYNTGIRVRCLARGNVAELEATE